MTKEIDKYLKIIISSTEFKNSSKYQELLRYLVKATLGGIVPKEVTIAYEVYGLDIDESSTHESNIRVYIYNLRKKLDSYYVREGKEDKIRFVIPKGRYKVEFVEKKENEAVKIRRLLKLSLGFIILLLAGYVYFVGNYFKGKEKEEFKENLNSFWGDFYSNDYPALVVLGDYYLVKSWKYQDRVRYIRDVRINSDEDYGNFLKEFSEEKKELNKTLHTLLGKFAPICINELNKSLGFGNKNFDIIMASDFQWHNVQENNIIYIGSFKSLRIFKELLVSSNFEFTVYPNELEFHQLEPDSVFHYYSTDSDIDHAYETDYAVVTKFPITDKTNILFFVSSRDIGLTATVKYFTNTETIKEFMGHFDQMQQDSFYFEACFKVQGLHRNTIDIELLHLNSFKTHKLNLPTQ